jgi:hypothetical protein
MTGMYSMTTQENHPAGDDPRRAGPGRLAMTPGRRTALLFGVPVCVALVAATGVSFVGDIGNASYPVHLAFPASATRIAVSNEGGQLTLRQAAIDGATLTGTAHYSLVRPHPPVASLSGGLASYVYRCPIPVGNCGLDATVTVPLGMAASVATGGGNASVIGTTGTVSLNTGGGELTAQDVSGAVTLNTGGGNITADKVSGTLSLNTDGGDIQASAIRSTGVTASSGGGNITIVFTAVPRDVSVSTGGGDITIEVPPGSAKYRVTTSAGGGSVNDSLDQSGSAPNVITATTGGGNITLRES